MREFIIGLVFIVGVSVLSLIIAGLGFLLFPLIIVMAALLRVAIVLIFAIACIWLIGRFVIWIFESLQKKV